MFDKVFRYVLSKQQKPDILYAHYLYNIAFGVHLKEKYHIPLIGLEHWSVLLKKQYTQRINELGCLAYNNADKLLAVSNSLANVIDIHFGRKPIVLHNMVGQEFIEANLIKKERKGNGFTFIAIGSLLPIKGFDLLIEAFYRFKTAMKVECDLIIIGDGQEREKLESLIESFSLKDSVILTGRKSKLEIISYLQNSDAFVLSSHSETFSVVCIEAMAVGLPVVATKCGGPEEFVNDEVGILIAPGELESLISGLEWMYANYDKYNKEYIAQYCKKNFSSEVVALKVEILLKDTIDEYHSLN